MSQEQVVIEPDDLEEEHCEGEDPEVVYRATMAGVTQTVWELTDDEHRVDDEALSALHDVIDRNRQRREALGG